MNKTDIQTGGFPFEAETLEFLEEAYALLQALGKLGHSGDYIVSGMEIQTNGNDTTITDGYMFYQGELLPFVGGVIPGVRLIDEQDFYITLIEDAEEVAYEEDVDMDGNGDLKDSYLTRYFTYGDTGLVTIDYYTLPRFSLKDSWYGKVYIPLGSATQNPTVTGDFTGVSLLSSSGAGHLYRVTFPSFGTAQYVPVMELETDGTIVRALEYNIKKTTATYFDVLIKDDAAVRLDTDTIIYRFLVQLLR